MSEASEIFASYQTLWAIVLLDISGEVVIMKMETCKDICHTFGMKELYSLRKETIERGSASAKENHEFWYMQMFGKA